MKEKKHLLDQPHHLLPPLPPHFSQPLTSATDEPTLELPRQRKGRPFGSKNKPNPPPSSSTLSISPAPNPTTTPLPQHHHPHHPPSLRTLLFQIDPDKDIVDSITHFCRHKSLSISLLSASGTLSHFTLHHPSSPLSALTFRGRFNILSLSATIVSKPNPTTTNNNNINKSSSVQSSFYLPRGFVVTVSDPQGQVVGGATRGPLIATGPVFVVSASFDKPAMKGYRRSRRTGVGSGVGLSGITESEVVDYD